MKLFVTKQEYKNLGLRATHSSDNKKINFPKINHQQSQQPKTPQKIKIYNNAHNAYKVFQPKNTNKSRDKEAEKQSIIAMHHHLMDMYQGNK